MASAPAPDRSVRCPARRIGRVKIADRRDDRWRRLEGAREFGVRVRISVGLRKAISIAIDWGWKPANARTMRAIISRVGASPPASLSVSSSIATITTPGGAGRAPARRKRQSRVRFSIRSSGEARPLISMSAKRGADEERRDEKAAGQEPGRSRPFSRHSLAETGKKGPHPGLPPLFLDDGRIGRRDIDALPFREDDILVQATVGHCHCAWSTSVEVWAFVTSIAHFVPRTAAMASGVRIWNFSCGLAG